MPWRCLPRGYIVHIKGDDGSILDIALDQKPGFIKLSSAIDTGDSSNGGVIRDTGKNPFSPGFHASSDWCRDSVYLYGTIKGVW